MTPPIRVCSMCGKSINKGERGKLQICFEGAHPYTKSRIICKACAKAILKMIGVENVE